MKLFWKQFISIIGIVAFGFVAFGTIILQVTFRMSLSQEQKQNEKDIQMFQYSLEASLKGLPEEYPTNENTIKEIVEVIYENIGENQDNIYVYQEDGTLIYKTSKTPHKYWNISLEKLQKGIICDFFEIQKKHLISCKKYAIYSSNKANGIQLWHLIYQNKENTIQLIMDAEFNHIYRFELSLSEGGDELRNQYFTQIEKEGEAAVFDDIYYSWTNNLSNYFTIDHAQFIYNNYPDMEPFYKKYLFLYVDLYYETAKEEHTNAAYSGKSITEVDDGNTISIFCEYYWKEQGGVSLSWGLPFFNSMMQL